MKQISRHFSIYWIAAKRLFLEEYTKQAAALAYTTLLSLVPLLSVTVSFIAIFPIFSKLINLARNYILTNFIPSSSSVIQQYLENFTQQASHLPKLSIFALFISAVMLVITIQNTLNDIWQKSSTPKKRAKFNWIFYWLVMILTPFFIGISIFLTSYLFSSSWVTNITTYFDIRIFLSILLSLLINSIVLGMFYKVVPHYKINWKDSFFGGFIAAILFEITKKGFELYLKLFNSYELIYGALAAIPIFLIWLYISWLVLIYGALLTHTRENV